MHPRPSSARPPATGSEAVDAGSLLGAEILAMVADEQARAERKAAQATARAARAAARAARRAIPPECAPQFAHLTLDGVRAYRHLVVREEERVGYWHRVLGTRLEALRGNGADVDTARLRPALERQQLGAGREAVLGVTRAGLPPLPALDVLWLDPAAAGTEEAVAGTVDGVAAYRESLAGEVRAATAELIARYRETPGEALGALRARRGA